MTVQTQIDNLNSTLRNISQNSKTTATNLIEGGAAYLRKLKSQKVPPIEFDPSPATLEAGKVFPGIPTKVPDDFELPADPSLQKVDVLTYAPFSEKLPTFTPPAMVYGPLKTDYSFTEKLPKLPKLPSLDDAPELEVPLPLEMIEPEWFEIEDVAVEIKEPDMDFELPEMPDLDYEALLKEQMRKFVEEGGLKEYVKWSNDLIGDTLFDDIVLDFLEKVMQGKATAVTDKWEHRKFDQALNEAMEAYRIETLALPQSRSTTGMPNGADISRWTIIELENLRKSLKAVEDVEAARRTTEIKHQKWVLALLVKMVGMGLELRLKGLSDGIKAMKLGLEAAVAAEEIVDMLFEFKKKQFALIDKYNKLLLDYVQKKTALEKTKLEKVKLESEQNKLLSGYNQNLAKDYDIAVRWLELRLAIYDAELEYFAIEQEDKQIAIENLSLSYKANRANTQSTRLAIKLLEGAITADKAKLRSEFTRFSEFEADLAKFKADVSSDLSMVKSQHGANKSKRAAWLAKIGAIIDYQQLLLSATQTTAQGLLAKYDADSDSQALEIDEQDFNNRKELEEERRTMQKEYTELRKVIYQFSMLVNQRLAQSITSIEGASTMGNIAEGALGGMTAIGSGSKTEYA